MMPPNFDNVLMIDERECVSPAGPPGARPGETLLRLDAWVLQPGGACMAFLPGPVGGGRWTMNPDPTAITLETGSGPVLGMGFMVSKKADGKTNVFHWTEVIQLK